MEPKAIRVAKDIELKIEVFSLYDGELEITPDDIAGGFNINQINHIFTNGKIILPSAIFLIKWRDQNILADAGAGQNRGGILLYTG